MKRTLLAVVATGVLIAGVAPPAVAAVQVFTCEPEWSALVQEVGGNRVNAFSATTGTQDPHHVTARPSLIAQMRTADLVVCTGAELEAGWLPLLLRQAGNAKVQGRGGAYIEAAFFAQMKEVPTTVDRRKGDVHPQGNPHIQTDPHIYLPVAKAIADKLAQIDPGGAADYQQRAAAFQQRWQQLIAAWEVQAASLNGLPVLVQHKNMTYLLDWLGMREVATLEPVPGVEPSTAYLTQVLNTTAAQMPRMVLVAGYQSDRPARWIAERARIPVVVLPLTVGGTKQATTLDATFSQTIAALLAASK